MFLLAKFGEAYISPEHAEALSKTFQTEIRGLLYASQTNHGVCNFHKGTKSCSEPSVFGTCFCSEHYGEKRKDFIRSFFKTNSIYIPNSTTLYPMDALTDRSWETFNQVLTRSDGTSCLNTLSLIVYVQHKASLIDLLNVKTSFERAGDFLGAEDAASFVNVKEFVAVFEEAQGVLYNASVKIWSNNQIQISGCKSVASALRITSAVVRTLQSIGELVDCVIISIKPVFANASFDFFPRHVSLAKMRTRAFLEGLEEHVHTTTTTTSSTQTQVEVGEQRDLFVQYAFKRDAHKTTVKTYHKGNVIITFNNFDGLLLQQSLQAMAKLADDHNIYVDGSLQICIEPGPDFFKEPSPRAFSFSPIASSASSSSSGFVGAKRKFGF